jgi:hypothetical protein
MANSVDYSDLQTLRNYVEVIGDEVMDLQLRGAPSLQYMYGHEGVTGKKQMEWVDINDIVKPWASPFAPDANTVDRKLITIENHFLKSELEFIPKEDYNHWKGYLRLMKETPESYPFARYIIEKATKKIATQLEFDTIWTADLAGTPTGASNFTNGLLTQIADDQALGTPVLTAVATGAITVSNAVDKVEQMDDAYNEEYRPTDMPLRMYCSPSVFKMYRRHYRTLNGYHPDFRNIDAKTEIQLDASSTILTVCPGMGSSQRLVLTPQDNIWFAYAYADDQETWMFDTEVRTLRAWSDYWFGVGFHIFDDRMIRVNDQA